MRLIGSLDSRTHDKVLNKKNVELRECQSMVDNFVDSQRLKGQ